MTNKKKKNVRGLLGVFILFLLFPNIVAFCTIGYIILLNEVSFISIFLSSFMASVLTMAFMGGTLVLNKK